MKKEGGKKKMEKEMMGKEVMKGRNVKNLRE